MIGKIHKCVSDTLISLPGIPSRILAFPLKADTESQPGPSISFPSGYGTDKFRSFQCILLNTYGHKIDISASCESPSVYDCIVLDGAAVVHSLSTAGAQNFL